MKILIQGDDFGFTKGVTYGIMEAIDHGYLTATGMFANMDIAPWAAEFVKERPDFCFGIDFNLVSGSCVSNPEKIPNLVDRNGVFIRSNKRVADPRWVLEEQRKEIYPYDEVFIEIKAQYNRFVELTGRHPKYLNGHSLVTKSIYDAIEELGKETNTPVSFDYMKKLYFTRAKEFSNQNKTNATHSKVFDPIVQMNKNPLKDFLEDEEVKKHEYIMIGTHPGYVDADLFEKSSLSIERCKDLAFVTSRELGAFIKENNATLISYDDLRKEGI